MRRDPSLKGLVFYRLATFKFKKFLQKNNNNNKYIYIRNAVSVVLVSVRSFFIAMVFLDFRKRYENAI
jgi:hypothetical protein